MAPINLVRKFVWRRLPIILLVSIAILQINLAHSIELSPWKGGGFGMFSVISKRYLAIQVTNQAGQKIHLDAQTLKQR